MCFPGPPVNIQNSTLRKIVEVELSGRAACLHQPGHIIHAELGSCEFIIESAEIFLLRDGEVAAADALLRSVADLVGTAGAITGLRYYRLCKQAQVIEWDRKEADRACSISVSIEADVINRDEWEKIARFHAEMTKQLADYAFYPYVQELKALDNTF